MLPPLLPCEGLVTGVFPVPPIVPPPIFPAPPPEPPFAPVPNPPLKVPPPPPPAEVMVENVEFTPLSPTAAALADFPAPPPPTVTE